MCMNQPTYNTVINQAQNDARNGVQPVNLSNLPSTLQEKYQQERSHQEKSAKQK